MPEPTRDDVDTLLGAATPHFAYQIRQRVERLIAELADDSPVRAYAAERLRALDELGRTNSKAVGGDPSAPRGE
ncbi:MAG TPA: hypothetical protein VGF46_12200 [Gaiellales bacterium]|jgi:hypothetical protein